jgi:isopentenyl diphosphate isomerase/L-lactate dehydrogenase-like FMN-dependent dehydrogenase
MARPYNIEGFRKIARRRLPRAVFDYLDGGAEDEVTLRANRESFKSLRLKNRIHAETGDVSLETTLCGQRMSFPVMLSPIGNSGMLHPSGDLAAATAAADRDLMMVMSGASSYSIEEIAAAVDPKPWYQLYPWLGHNFYGPLIDRAAAAGFRGLAVTVDTPCSAIRERDIVNAFTHPPRLTRRNAFQILGHPRWTGGVLRRRRVVVKLFAEDPHPTLLNFVRHAKQSGGAMARTLSRPTWSDLAWIRDRWTGPMGVKGVTDPDDARRAVDLGADVIFVSNHGGRQLDGAPATLEALPAIVEAVDGRAEVVLDGGVRRGSDIVKALCLGARAVSVGRAWGYALAADGQDGVGTALDMLRRELTVCLTLLGQTNVVDLDRSYLAPAGVPGLDQLQDERR